MLEAQAFAYLAVRVLRGLPTSAPMTTGVAAPVGGGRVSRAGRRLGGLPPSPQSIFEAKMGRDQARSARALRIRVTV